MRKEETSRKAWNQRGKGWERLKRSQSYLAIMWGQLIYSKNREHCLFKIRNALLVRCSNLFWYFSCLRFGDWGQNTPHTCEMNSMYLLQHSYTEACLYYVLYCVILPPSSLILDFFYFFCHWLYRPLKSHFTIHDFIYSSFRRWRTHFIYSFKQ